MAVYGFPTGVVYDNFIKPNILGGQCAAARVQVIDGRAADSTEQVEWCVKQPRKIRPYAGVA